MRKSKQQAEKALTENGHFFHGTPFSLQQQGDHYGQPDTIPSILGTQDLILKGVHYGQPDTILSNLWTQDLLLQGVLCSHPTLIFRVKIPSMSHETSHSPFSTQHFLLVREDISFSHNHYRLMFVNFILYFDFKIYFLKRQINYQKKTSINFINQKLKLQRAKILNSNNKTALSNIRNLTLDQMLNL